MIGVLVQTAEAVIGAGPLPSVASVLAARLTLVLHDPLHFLYTKANEFLNKSPTWNPSKLPSYWIDKIFLLPPEQDEAHTNEVAWLLETLVQGLRSQNVRQSTSVTPCLIITLGSESVSPKCCFRARHVTSWIPMHV